MISGVCVLNCPVQAIDVYRGIGCAWVMIDAAIRGKDMDSGVCGYGGDTVSCCGDQKENHPAIVDVELTKNR
ncbi:MAG TPA: hypothetical protein VN372_11705 [Methanospirillum sp.]|nr:hypothetical protein [Methanospirillum sp.]